MVEAAKVGIDLTYKSVVTDELIVMGSEDMEKFESQIQTAQASQMKVIGTHSDAFHCDEVLATTLLRYTRAYANSLIIRSRDEAVFPKMDIICDVGGVYDAEKHRYDHH